VSANDGRSHAVIAERRLRRQLVTQEGPRRPADVVCWLGAVQAQEYDAAKWALGLRMREGTLDEEIERAFERGQILRTHVMRPTWHFVTPADIRWLLELTAPRVHRAMSSYNRRFELDARTQLRGTAIIERALGDARHLTRTELGDRLKRDGLVMAGPRLALLTMYAELEGVMCSGPRRGKQFTYALLAERAPSAGHLKRDEALATLCRRYFTSHGPATVRDFVWWSGLTTADARRGLEMNRARRDDVGSQTYWTIGDAPRRTARSQLAHLLPIYDEYLVAYRDREAVPHGPSIVTSEGAGSVNFRHRVVIAGHVAGTWRTTQQEGRLLVHVIPLRRLTGRERRALGDTARRYERFLSVPITLRIDAGPR
jgi:DNA glycosylase AlkZ-like